LLIYFLYGLFILSCIVLVITVLLQPGKADAGALFSSSVSSTAFGPRGTQTILAKITIAAAALFMLVALTLSLPAVTGTRSVLQSQPAEPASQPAPTTNPAPASTNTAPAQGETNGTAPTNTNAAPASTTATPASSPQAQASPAKK
jgi:preprotein translocase subunit SecG